MPLRKTAIARVLQEAVRARRDTEVTKRLNELFADPELVQEQTWGASDLDAVGTDWSDERW